MWAPPLSWASTLACLIKGTMFFVVPRREVGGGVPETWRHALSLFGAGVQNSLDTCCRFGKAWLPKQVFPKRVWGTASCSQRSLRSSLGRMAQVPLGSRRKWLELFVVTTLRWAGLYPENVGVMSSTWVAVTLRYLLICSLQVTFSAYVVACRNSLNL